MIQILYPSCPLPVRFAHMDAALGFLRTMAKQITPEDFVQIVVASSGAEYAELARQILALCLGSPT